MRKIGFIVSLTVILWISGGFWILPVYAEPSTADTGGGTGSTGGNTESSHPTVLPGTEKSVLDCKKLMNEVNKNSCKVQKNLFGKKISGDCSGPNTELGNVNANDVLACGIKTGDIHLWMIPYYIRYVLEFIIGIAGLISVGGIVYGGYLYLFAGISQDKDKGKKAILYGVVGMILTLVAWALVNIVIALVTG